MNKLMYNRKQASELLSISTAQFDRFVRQGLIEKVVLGRRCVRFRHADLQEFCSHFGTTTGNPK